MKKMKKFISLLLVASLAVSLAACGKNGSDTGDAEAPTKSAEATVAPTESAEEAAAPTATAPDISEKVDLVFYLVGDIPKDEQMVEDAINKILLEKANATIDVQCSTWTDYVQKYNLVLTSNAADLIYTANWLNYGTLANSGAFADITDMLAANAPGISKSVPSSSLDQCKIGGKLYGIPNTQPEYTVSGISYREDLREKYNLPIPNSIENLEAYLLGIKQNDPQQGLLTTVASPSLSFAFEAIQILALKYPWIIPYGLPYGLTANYDTPSDIYDYWNSEDFVTDMKLMKKFADEGLWSRSALSDTANADAYKNGLCAAVVAGQNPGKDMGAYEAFEKQHPDWKTEFVAYGETTGVIFPAHPTSNMTSVAASSKNPERALMVLDLLMYDEELNRLFQYGIEDTHYEIDADGNYKNLSESFKAEGFNGWALRTDYVLSFEPAKDAITKARNEKYSALAAKTKFPGVNIYGGFAEDYSEYQVERSAVSDVMRQYLAPLQAGLVSDVDKAVAEFREKAKEAGLETCQEQYKAQWIAYCDEYGYK